MRRKGNQIARAVPPQEDLGSDGVARGPGDEVHSYGDGFLSLACDLQHGREEGLAGGGGERDGVAEKATYVATQHAHPETLGRPEGEDDVVGEEQTCGGGGGGVLHGHENDGADEGGDAEEGHDEDVLVGFLGEVGGAEEDDDYECSEDHGEELGSGRVGESVEGVLNDGKVGWGSLLLEDCEA